MNGTSQGTSGSLDAPMLKLHEGEALSSGVFGTKGLNVLYFVTTEEERKKGNIKIGKAFWESPYQNPESSPLRVFTDLPDTKTDELFITSPILEQVVRDRYKDMKTLRMQGELQVLGAFIALKPDTTADTKVRTSFTDREFHHFLLPLNIQDRSGTGYEWFNVQYCDAIEYLRQFMHGNSVVKPIVGSTKHYANAITLRPEQREFVDQTKKLFRKGEADQFGFNAVLWNAVMRFGKTITALMLGLEIQAHRILILTHRPVVSKGWIEDAYKVLHHHGYKIAGRRELFPTDTNVPYFSVDQLEEDDKALIFVSLQDIRGSGEMQDGATVEDFVNSKNYTKNARIFEQYYDLLVIDEAHEGWGSERSGIVSQLIDRKYELLLSGTAFNIIQDYEEDRVLSWTYADTMRQKRAGVPHLKYAPELVKYSFNAASEFPDMVRDGHPGVNFNDLFATAKSEHGDGRPEFVFVADVVRFLKMISEPTVEEHVTNEFSHFPLRNPAFRAQCQHMLWMMPSVDASIAMGDLISQQFSHLGTVINATGVNYRESTPSAQNARTALEAVETAIRGKGDQLPKERTITLTVGQLSVGVTIPEMSAILFMDNTTSLTKYNQALFRIMSTYKISENEWKRYAYAFDFNSDRSFKMIYEEAEARAGKDSSQEEINEQLAGILDTTPVKLTLEQMRKLYPEETVGNGILTHEESSFLPVNTDILMRKINRVFIDEIVQRQFDSPRLFKLNTQTKIPKETMAVLQEFSKSFKVGSSITKIDRRAIHAGTNDGTSGNRQTSPYGNSQDGTPDGEGQSGEGTPGSSTDPQPDTGKSTGGRSDEDRKRDNYRRSIRKVHKTLVAVTQRMALLMFALDKDGAPLRLEDILDRDMVDDEVFSEFMPEDVTREKVEALFPLIERDLFEASLNRFAATIDNTKDRDPIDRIFSIFETFKNFKHPDKETILTPMPVVDLQLTRTLGGYNWFASADAREEPRWNVIGDQVMTVAEIHDSESRPSPLFKYSIMPGVDQIWSQRDARILEINSKSAFYPLLAAMSFYLRTLSKLPAMQRESLSVQEKNKIFDRVVRENIFVNTRTPYAKRIAKKILGEHANVSTVDIAEGTKKLKSLGVPYAKDVIEPVYEEPTQEDYDKWQNMSRPKNPDTKGYQSWLEREPRLVAQAKYEQQLIEYEQQSRVTVEKVWNYIFDARWVVPGRSLSDIQDDRDDGVYVSETPEARYEKLQESESVEDVYRFADGGSVNQLDGDQVEGFHAVIGNPPYQIDTGGKRHQIYGDFYQVVKGLGRYTSLIFPLGWQTTTGRASGSVHHIDMRADRNIVSVNNYFEDPKESDIIIFDGTGTGGVNIVLRDNEYDNGGLVDYYEYGEFVEKRDLSEVKYWSDETEEIFNKLSEWMDSSGVRSVSEDVSPRGTHLPSSRIFGEEKYQDFVSASEKPGYILCYGSMPESVGTVERSTYGWFWIDKKFDKLKLQEDSKFSYNRYKVVFGQAGGANTTWRKAFVAPKDSVVTASYLGIYFDTEKEAQNFMGYIRTLLYRFAHGESAPTHHTSPSTHRFVPDLSTIKNPRTGLVGWDSDWTDDDLKQLFNDVLTAEDWKYIEETALNSDPTTRVKDSE